MDLIQTTKDIWKAYFLGDDQDNPETSLLDSFDPDCIIIGTGKHEFYRNVNEFAQAYTAEMQEQEEINFQFRDLWCEQKVISDDVVLVYGGIYIWWESDDKSIYINMDSRYSILYQKVDGKWKIIHVHQSLPNMEQMDGEYYPKTLSEQVKETQGKVDELEELAQKDSLTGLVNYRHLQEIYASRMKDREWLFVVDLDCFKQINDSYGHVAGNHILKRIAEILTSTMRSCDIVCRMGGDEFIILCEGLMSEEGAYEMMQRVLNNVADGRENEDYWVSLSMGGTEIREGEALESALKRADDALYEVKSKGRNGTHIIL